MKAYIAFSKKELLESVRTYRLFIFAVIFLLFAVMSPVTAKLTPKIMEMALPEGVTISIGNPTAMDSWQQFFKNIGQMGLFVLVIMNSGMLVREMNKGTLINLLTKGLTRKVVLLSKFSVSVFIWTVTYWVSFGVTYYYTYILWKEHDMKELGSAVGFLWLFGIFLIALVLLSSTFGKGTYIPLLFTGGVIAIMLFIQVFPNMNHYNPIRLVEDGYAIIAGNVSSGDLVRPMIVTLISTVVSIIISFFVFDRRKV